ncbi:MAG: hypothetical protein WCW13_03705 [archaeon]|jgi:hypothetical protein
MGLFDFLKEKRENKWAKEKEPTAKVVLEKKDLGVCVPIHALNPDERKKMSKKKEINPFDKLRVEHLKETDAFNKEFKELSEQEPQEPYDYEPDLGVESIEQKKQEPTVEYDSTDELDVASQKMSEGYVPRFSSTARQKLGLETKAPQVVHVAGSLEVTGMYVGAETMISGRVISGRLKKSMTASLGKGTVRICDLKQGSSAVSQLNEGESGTIFVRGIANMIRTGDVIDFC